MEIFRHNRLRHLSFGHRAQPVAALWGIRGEHSVARAKADADRIQLTSTNMAPTHLVLESCKDTRIVLTLTILYPGILLEFHGT